MIELAQLIAMQAEIQELQNARDHNDYGADALRFGADISDPARTAVVIFLVDTEYNGENFKAGDVLFGNNTTGVDNFVYKNNVLQVRTGSSDNVTINSNGVRFVRGGAAFRQYATTVGSGTVDLTENGDFINASYVYISASTGAFTINSIAEPVNPNHFMIIVNGTTNDMTIQDVSAWADPGEGYWGIQTQTGASRATTGRGSVLLIGNETTSQWELLSIEG